MRFLLEFPAVVSAFLVCVVTLAIALAGVRIVRKRFPHEVLKENHEVAGFIYNSFMLIYAVLVAFVVFVSWSDYSQAERNTEIEANLLTDLFMDARGLPDTMRVNVQQTIISYLESIINDEWETMKRGRPGPKAREEFAKLWQLYMDADVKSLPNEPVYRESLTKLNQVGEHRRLRIFAANDFIPGFIWFVLIICATASVSYTFFFGSKYAAPQYIMTGVLTLINSLILYLIFVLDHPFNGVSGVSSSSFNVILRILQHMK